MNRYKLKYKSIVAVFIFLAGFIMCSSSCAATYYVDATNGRRRQTSRPKYSTPRLIFWGSIAVCLAIIASGVALAATKKAPATTSIITYPQPTGTQKSAVFSVTVNDQPVFVEEYKDINYAHFSFAGKVDIKVTVKENIQKYTLSPKSYNIASISNGREISFSLDRPRKLILHKVNSLDEKLFIFADPLEDNPPKLGDSGVVNIMDYGLDNTGKTNENKKIQRAINNLAARVGGGVIYFPPGVYKTGDLYMKNKVTMYLAGGARLYYDGRTFIYFNDILDNASLIGRGVLEGHALRLKNSNNISINGVIFRPHNLDYWTMDIERCDFVTIYNTKTIADWGLGRDGFDPDRSTHVLIDNVFYYGGDDAVSVKNMSTGRNVTDINVRSSVFYAGSSACKIGTETYNDLIQNVTFENIDVVSYSHRGLNVSNADGGTVDDVYFKNIRVEQWLNRADVSGESMIDFILWQRGSDPVGYTTDIHVLNLTSDVSMPSVITGYDNDHKIENVILDNYYIGDNLIENTTEGNIVMNHNVKNLIFANSNPTIVSITATDLYASESKANPGIFTIRRTGNTSEKVTVNYTIRGTAENGKDYQSIPTSVTIPAGAASTTIAVTPIDDNLDEGLETVFISLDNLPHTTNSYMLGPDFHAVVNIIDDNNDPPKAPAGLTVITATGD